MRQIILDTETTGLEPKKGHRIIEIGCVELKNRRKTDRHFHQYLNPEREIEDGAYDVHGLSTEFLQDKPLFSDVADEFIEFIRDSELIIHNAPFDVEFLNSELDRLDGRRGGIEEYCKVIDTLVMARELHPGQKNSLDALCARYEVDNSERDLHGALLDAQILLDVYLAMTGGQASLSLDVEMNEQGNPVIKHQTLEQDRPALRVIKPSESELQAHQNRLRAITRESGETCIWEKVGE